MHISNLKPLNSLEKLENTIISIPWATIHILRAHLQVYSKSVADKSETLVLTVNYYSYSGTFSEGFFKSWLTNSSFQFYIFFLKYDSCLPFFSLVWSAPVHATASKPSWQQLLCQSRANRIHCNNISVHP